MLRQEVDLVHIQKTPVYLLEQSALRLKQSLFQGRFKIDRADQPILGRVQRQLHKGSRLQQLGQAPDKG